MLKNSQEFIKLNKEKEFPTDNDGVFIPEETVWGTHLARLVGDHSELAGLRINLNPEANYRTILEKTKY